MKALGIALTAALKDSALNLFRGDEEADAAARVAELLQAPDYKPRVPPRPPG